MAGLEDVDTADATISNSIDKTARVDSSDKDSDASYLSDVEEVDHMKTSRVVEELMFDDSYFRQEQKPDGDNAHETQDTCDGEAEESADSTPRNPWERLADWIHCFCVVTFDLEIGQMIEVTCNKQN